MDVYEVKHKLLCSEGTNLYKLGVNTRLCLCMVAFIVTSGLVGYFCVVIDSVLTWEDHWFEILFTSVSLGMSMIILIVIISLTLVLTIYGLPCNYYYLVKRSIDEVVEYMAEEDAVTA